MHKTLFSIALISLFFNACTEGTESGNEKSTVDTLESEASTLDLEEKEMAESTPDVLAFDGTEKGDYLLYGHSEIEVAGSISIEDMNATIAETGEFEGKVNVNIAEVCKKAGCWITFNDGDDEVRVFFRDHFTIPTETLPGTEAVLYGSVMLDTLTVDFQKHLLDDEAEAGEEVSQDEYDAITEPLIETTFDCEAILVRQVAP